MGFYQEVYAIGMSIFPILTGKIAATAGMHSAYLVLGEISLAGSAAAVMQMRILKKQ